MRVARCWVLACLIVLSVLGTVGAAPAAADAPVQIAGASLTPGFDEAISDYTVKCDTPVDLAVNAPDGVSVAIDGGSPQTGAFNASVNLQPDQGVQLGHQSRGPAPTTYHARCLPADFPAFTVERPGRRRRSGTSWRRMSALSAEHPVDTS